MPVVKAMSRLPDHIVIIMDGNGRWAQRQNLPRSSGHQAGVKTTRKIVEHCARLGVRALTVYAFSSENWKRPKNEVSFLMELFVRALGSEIDKLHKNNISIKFIGEVESFPENLQQQISSATSKTADNTGLQLNIAVNYGGRRELVLAMKSIAAGVQDGTITPEQIDEHIITRHTWLENGPEPDLFIRTGGDQRLSNYLLWHLAYTELVFTNTLWPDFNGEEFDEIIADYAQRQRRFGQTGEQVMQQQGDD